jgi:hypothetical protein
MTGKVGRVWFGAGSGVLATTGGALDADGLWVPAGVWAGGATDGAEACSDPTGADVRAGGGQMRSRAMEGMRPGRVPGRSLAGASIFGA